MTAEVQKHHTFYM